MTKAVLAFESLAFCVFRFHRGMVVAVIQSGPQRLVRLRNSGSSYTLSPTRRLFDAGTGQ